MIQNVFAQQLIINVTNNQIVRELTKITFKNEQKLLKEYPLELWLQNPP